MAFNLQSNARNDDKQKEIEDEKREKKKSFRDIILYNGNFEHAIELNQETTKEKVKKKRKKQIKIRQMYWHSTHASQNSEFANV